MLSDGELAKVLGFKVERAAFPAAPVAPGRQFSLTYFQRAMPGFVWDAAALEGNPYTYPEVQTLMDGVTVGGHKVSDEIEVQGIIRASRHLASVVESGEFTLSREVSAVIHAAVGRDAVFDAGMFRGVGPTTGTPGVNLGEYGHYYPLSTEPGGANLIAQHDEGVAAIFEYSQDPWVQALLYNMMGCFGQFYFDGNKRTSRLMMNGHLMMHGFEPISIPAAERREYNSVMVEAYRLRDASKAVAFIGGCHERIRREREGRPQPPTPPSAAASSAPWTPMSGTGPSGPRL